MNDRGIAALAYNVLLRPGVKVGFGMSFDTQHLKEASHKVLMPQYLTGHVLIVYRLAQASNSRARQSTFNEAFVLLDLNRVWEQPSTFVGNFMHFSVSAAIHYALVINCRNTLH